MSLHRTVHSCKTSTVPTFIGHQVTILTEMLLYNVPKQVLVLTAVPTILVVTIHAGVIAFLIRKARVQPSAVVRPPWLRGESASEITEWFGSRTYNSTRSYTCGNDVALNLVPTSSPVAVTISSAIVERIVTGCCQHRKESENNEKHP